MEKRKVYGALDWFRIVAAVLVIAIHTSPFSSVNAQMDFVVTRVLARVAVPFFFMVTGHFMLMADAGTKKRWYVKMLLLYAGAILFYIPIGIYAGHWQKVGIAELAKRLLFDGTFYHLWYFPACMLGLLLTGIGCRFLPVQAMLGLTIVLYVVGLFGDSYYGAAAMLPAASRVYAGIFRISSYTRNGLFFAPLFILSGALLGRYMDERGAQETGTAGVCVKWGCGFVLALLGMCGEGLWLHRMAWQRHDSMYILLPVVMLCLYRLLLAIPMQERPVCRTVALWVYVLHPLVIVLVRGGAGVLSLTDRVVSQSVIFYVVVVAGTFVLAMGIGSVKQYVSRKKGHSNKAGCR